VALPLTHLVRREALDFAFFEAGNDTAFRTEIDHLWFGITEVESEEKVICRDTTLSVQLDCRKKAGHTERRCGLFISLFVFASAFWARPFFYVAL